MGTVRAPARGSRGAVVRTYAAPDRETAERSYDDDRLAAGERGWVPVSRFWRSEGRDQVLTVVFELTLADSVLTSQVEVEDAAARRKVEGTGPHWTVAASGSLLSRSVPPLDAGAPVPWDEERARQRDASRRQVTTLDLHCAGEPLRLIRTGFPEVPQAPIAERRLWAIEHADDVRRMIMHEPRGHRDMYGAVLLPPDRPDADIAVLFMHNEGYSTMCGHGIIALTHGLIEEGLYPATQPATTIRWETPAGLVTATAEVRVSAEGAPLVRAVRFVNVPGLPALGPHRDPPSRRSARRRRRPTALPERAPRLRRRVLRDRRRGGPRPARRPRARERLARRRSRHHGRAAA